MASSSAAPGQGAPGVPSAPAMDPWAVPYINPVTQAEIDSYNLAIDASESRCLDKEVQRSQNLLSKLKMPEDVAIASKRASGSSLIDELAKKRAKANDDLFVWDPEVRAAQAARQRNLGRIRVLRGGSRRKVEAGALGAGEAPGTPLPQSPRLMCPGQASMKE